MIITTNENNPNALKLIIAAKFADLPITWKTVLPQDVATGRLPYLQLSSGTSLFSVNAAAQFLVPIHEQFFVASNEWMEWDATQLQPALVAYGGSGKLDPSHKPRVWSLLKHLATHLKNKKALVEDNSVLSIADAIVWVTLWSTLSSTEVGAEIATEFSDVRVWMNTIQQLPVIQAAIAEYKVEKGIKAITSIQAAAWFPQNSYSSWASHRSVPNKGNITKENEMENVSDSEILSINKSWTSRKYPAVKESVYPVLPKQGEKNILITSALPYVNNVPHLGNIIGCVLSADIFARYCRQRNYNTLYICGTDEYGTATEAKAVEENLTPQQICDKYFSIHNDIYRWFSIGFDYFGRTTTPEQTEIVQAFFLRLKEKGFINAESVDQLLCQKCDRFLADRFVEGICPGCKYEDARGDQCDGCGHLVNATELINPRCKVCNHKPIIQQSTQFFLDLPKIEPRLRSWASSVENEWSTTARVVAKPWLRDDLKPRCITRDLKWGIPVPLDGYRNKVFYVWFDAPIGYMSITKRYTKDYEQWWKPKDHNINLYQFMAKDNVPFHCVMFPAALLAADDGYTLVKHIMAIEYLNYEDTKFSKSRGIGVFGTDARDTGIPADVWRFYLAYVRPESQDSNFNWVDLATKNNSELLNNLGNFVNRALTFAEKNFESKVPPIHLQEDDLIVLALAQRELTSYVAAMEKTKMRDALRHILAISKHGNQYMQSQQPWVMIKGTDDDKKKAGTVIGVCCNLACLLSALLGPYIPNTSRELRSQLGLVKADYGYIPDTITCMLESGHKLGKPSPLFNKIEDQQIEILRKKYGGKQDSPPRESPKITTIAEGDVASLEAAVAKQAQLVRDLKAKGDKSVWQPQVAILLQLKKQLAQKTAAGPTTGDKANADNSKKPASTVSEQNGSGTQDVASLEAAITKQGLLVRELKAKEGKSVWQPQVDILLSLKKQLSALTGATAASDKKSKKKKNEQLNQ